MQKQYNEYQQPPAKDLRSIQLQLTGSIGFEEPSGPKPRMTTPLPQNMERRSKFESTNITKVLQNKNKMSKPKTIMWASSPRTCVTVIVIVGGDAGVTDVASSSPLVMMAANVIFVCVYTCVCKSKSQSAERERAALVFIGDWDCGLAYLHSNSSVDVDVSVVVDVDVATASRRNESKQANKQMRHQSCH